MDITMKLMTTGYDSGRWMKLAHNVHDGLLDICQVEYLEFWYQKFNKMVAWHRKLQADENS